MKIEVIRDICNFPNGFKLIPDRNDKDEVDNINIIRDMIFFTIGKQLKYDGREDSSETCAGTLKFKMKDSTWK